MSESVVWKEGGWRKLRRRKMMMRWRREREDLEGRRMVVNVGRVDETGVGIGWEEWRERKIWRRAVL